ncbi:MAG TPA: trigger factor [candidate division Zixibacteria bacterium]|nr:trigger factor [candidate division Zixibacteria bacterium]
MKSEVKETEGLLREVTVQIPVEAVNSEMEKQFAQLRKEVTLKGFRKGKAPMDRIKGMYEQQVKAEVVEELIRKTYPDAVREHQLRVASHPTVTEADFDDSGAFIYTAQVEVFPEIGNIVYNDLKVKLPKIEVKDEDVDEFVDAMRKGAAELRVVNREVQESDVVVADLKKLLDPQLILDSDLYEDEEIDLENAATVNEFRDNLQGMKSGESKDIEVVYPEDYPDEKFAGASIKYNVTVKNVKERILPEINDDFAKMTGQAETVLELRIKIREELKNRIDKNHDRNKRGQLIEQMCTQNEIPVPGGLVESYLDKVVEDFKRRYSEIDETKLRDNYRSVGERTIRWNMILQKLAQQENIEVLPSDVENRIKMFADNYQMSVEEAKQALANAGTIDDIKDSITEEKVLDFLVGKATVEHTEPNKG